MNLNKIRKFFRESHIFFRDFLNKRFPPYNVEQSIPETEEFTLINADANLASLTENVLPNFPIDVVFTWVDNTDKAWQEQYYRTLQPIDQEDIGLYATDPARFSNHNELFYSVQAVQKFMPWVRNIFIVTADQKPKWLDENIHSKIKLINHSQLIDAKYLPTFNSHVIEANLYKIPDLSEHFIYFNDDVFVARPLMPNHFFENNGLASLFVANKSFQKMRQRGLITPTLTASEHALKLLKRHYPTININTPLVHTYVPLRKTSFQKAWSLFEDEINSFLNNKVRHNSELNMASFLIPWLMYLDGYATPKREICYYFNIRSSHAQTQYKKLLFEKEHLHVPHSFCINDSSSNNADKNYALHFRNFMDTYFEIETE
ncbi:stealth family protein [Neisseria meningitidis]|uniref:stealth family protein n=1 Tax=Neisseria meningitidis TaxID=487 RepID=UPI000E588E9E|nr:stealth family protein [Neisseria meningitidis]